MKNKIWLLLLIALVSCGKKNSNPAPTIPAPEKATLVFPALNAACTAGTIISSTQSTIIFNWNASANTNSYDLTIKNLLTGVSNTQNASTNQLSVTLLRNTPYSWYVVSKSNATTSTNQSDVWKFYNSGPGTVSYPPFPATISAPGFAEILGSGNRVINLVWVGTDVDKDIVSYDVFFGTSNTPALLKSNIADQYLNNVSVSSQTTYYWKVITKDSQGNTSDSGLYQFSIN